MERSAADNIKTNRLRDPTAPVADFCNKIGTKLTATFTKVSNALN